ncbi:MAG: hypothetical protein RDU20_19915 [Desulfomonilaceae bacterium]|nr:hypothetical protein [Desulfomonilaceae bacterium]
MRFTWISRTGAPAIVPETILSVFWGLFPLEGIAQATIKDLTLRLREERIISPKDSRTEIPRATRDRYMAAGAAWSYGEKYIPESFKRVRL